MRLLKFQKKLTQSLNKILIIRKILKIKMKVGQAILIVFRGSLQASASEKKTNNVSTISKITDTLAAQLLPWRPYPLYPFLVSAFLFYSGV